MQTTLLPGSGWHIIEEGWNPGRNRVWESIFSLGNGHMGLRGNFEESYSGDTLQGSYIAGIYYPDPTKVGWWKNGYPNYFAKVPNAANWIGIGVEVDGEVLDLNRTEVLEFSRVLHMREGYLQRNFRVRMKQGRILEVTTRRLCSIARQEIGALQYSIRPVNFSGRITLTCYLDGDVKNEDSNFDEKFWDPMHQEAGPSEALLLMKTRKTGFQVCTGMHFWVESDGNILAPETRQEMKEKFAASLFSIEGNEGQTYSLYKIVANVSSLDYPGELLVSSCNQKLQEAVTLGYDGLVREQALAWKHKWESMDILIEGDPAAQQGIRFNIFQLHQTYTGKDERLNISPKGFTGEKYGGCTYWDTEAYCLPFFLGTAGQRVSRNLLLYRYRQLDKAIENAAKLGFGNGAALFPMVTINGEECHNEWEITFEEIHRNGAIAYAIYNYCRYTGDTVYLEDFGLEVLIALARFWSQRVNWSEERKAYVILGVTGPNEYENNVQNNWYTNTMAAWSLEFAIESIQQVRSAAPVKFSKLQERLGLDTVTEISRWKRIAEKMYFPWEEKLGIYLQQDGYLDKEQLHASDIPSCERPIHNHWSWDRILRSCFIKQADVLQGIYFFEERFDDAAIARHFNFYESRTVHESSLSPCVHSILASKIGNREKAYALYLRTARLDLDDYNDDTRHGLHITSMAGTWMSIVQGFAGMRFTAEGIRFSPFIPGNWKAYSFNLLYRQWQLHIQVDQQAVHILNRGSTAIKLHIFEEGHSIGPGQLETRSFNSSVYAPEEKQ
jgi:maltose phosphorylase